MLGSGPISWASKKQSTVACSSTESEYYALSETARETVWLRKLLGEMGQEQDSATTIWEDNQQTIVWALDAAHHGRNKHIDVRLHYVRDQVRRNVVKVQYTPTEDQLADLLTKPLGRLAFQRLVKKIMDFGTAGVCEISGPPRVD